MNDYILYFSLTLGFSTLFPMGGIGAAIALVPPFNVAGLPINLAKAIGLFINTSSTITALVILAIFLARLFRESSFGLQLRACADDEVGARAMGIDIYRTRLIGWIISTLFFATAGIAYAFFLGTISAGPFYFNYVFLTIAMLILGGLRSVSGAVFDTLLITIGLEVVRWLETGPTLAGVKLPEMLGLSGLLLGVVIVGVMAFLPKGIMGNREVEELFRKKPKA